MKPKEYYERLTHSLHWDPTYISEGEYIPDEWKTVATMPDWKKFGDPFQILFEDYIRIQAEKEGKYHAVRDAAARFGHIAKVDPRWVEGMKSFNTPLTFSEYHNYRGHLRIARFAPAPAIRVAAMVQAMDERRHTEEAIYEARDYFKYHPSRFLDPVDRYAFFERHWLFQGDKSFFEDLITTDPIEGLIGTNLVFETAFTNLLFIAAPAAGVANGDFAFGQAHLTIQTDETRHMALGQAVARALLQEEPSNIPLVQDWVDKWFWRCHRLFAVAVSIVLDYFPRNKPQSYKEAFQRYVVDDFIEGYTKELSRFGLRAPRHLDEALEELEHSSHTVWRNLYQNRALLFFDVHQPEDADLAWFNDKYPSFDRVHGDFWRSVRRGDPVETHRVPMTCALCKIPCIFPEPSHPKIIPHEYRGKKYWFCSYGCKWIFEREPNKYAADPSIAEILADKDPAWALAYLNMTADGKPAGGIAIPPPTFERAMPVPKTYG
jgi:phenol/toluene 2-monooxygenase (NADH) P3/A3